MASTFNSQILVEKLTKLNSSQQSIETLSHWCIFHMNKAKLVVETWDRQFHCSPREQRLAFLYLANDILQNSRRKGSEFVGEFWKVLPSALNDVIRHGDEFSRNGAVRLVGIWDERKVFGSQGQLLKEGITGRMPENTSRNEKQPSFKFRQPAANTLDKIASEYQILYRGDLDEDAILNKYSNTVISFEKIEKQIGSNIESGQSCGSGVVAELQDQLAVFKKCIQNLMAIQALRESLVTHLREALQEQEYKLDLVRKQLQAAQAHSDQAVNLSQQLQNVTTVHEATEQNLKEVRSSDALPYVPQSLEQSAPVMYTREMSSPGPSILTTNDLRKSTAAEVAAKLTASTSSAQMLSYVLSSLSSEGIIGDPVQYSAVENPPEKKSKLDNGDQAYVPQHPLPLQKPFIHPESLHQNVLTSTTQKLTSCVSSSVQSHQHIPLAQFPMPQYIPIVGSVSNAPYIYGPPPPGYSSVGVPVTGISSVSAPHEGNAYHTFQGSDVSSCYSQTSSLPLPPTQMAPQPQ